MLSGVAEHFSTTTRFRKGPATLPPRQMADSISFRDSSAHLFINKLEARPVSPYHRNAAIHAVVVVRAVMIDVVNTTELIQLIYDGFIAIPFSSFCFCIVYDRRQRHHASPGFTCPYDPPGKTRKENILPPLQKFREKWRAQFVELMNTFPGSP